MPLFKERRNIKLIRHLQIVDGLLELVACLGFIIPVFWIMTIINNVVTIISLGILFVIFVLLFLLRLRIRRLLKRMFRDRPASSEEGLPEKINLDETDVEETPDLIE